MTRRSERRRPCKYCGDSFSAEKARIRESSMGGMGQRRRNERFTDEERGKWQHKCAYCEVHVFFLCFPWSHCGRTSCDCPICSCTLRKNQLIFLCARDTRNTCNGAERNRAQVRITQQTSSNQTSLFSQIFANVCLVLDDQGFGT